MNYEITDLYHQIIIKLNSNLTIGQSNSIYLKTYINQGSAPALTSVPISTNPITFRVKQSEFNIGDRITKMVVELSGSSIPLYNLNEAISVLVDGDETEVDLAENGTSLVDSDNNRIKSKMSHLARPT